MGSIAAEIGATLQRIRFTILIDNQEVADVFEANISLGYDQINAQATLKCYQRPSWAVENSTCQVYVSYNNSTPALLFSGELSGVIWEYFPGVVGIDARGILDRLRFPWGGDDRAYTSQDDAAIIQNLIEAYGIPSSQTSIESSAWTLGTIEDVVLKTNDTAWSLIERIDKLAGYKTYVTSDGVIRRRRISGAASPTAAWSYTEGSNILKARRIRQRDGIINKMTVNGLTYEDLEITAEASAANEFVPNPPEFFADDIQDNLVESNEKALEIAYRFVSDFNRRPESLELEVIGNPVLQPGSTIGVVHSDLEVASGLLFIEHLEHRITANSFLTTIKTNGGTLSGGLVSVPPIVQFDAKFFLEHEDTGAGVVGMVVCIADSTGTVDPDGDSAQMTYAWTISATGDTPSVTSSTEPVVRFFTDATVTDVTLQLDVTDISGAVGTLTRVFETDTTVLPTEDLYVARSTAVCTVDGGANWRTQTPASGNATCLMPYAPAWGQIWGTTTGHIYATFDNLESALVDLGQPAGAVACTAVWVHEQTQTRLWAGFTNGKVYFGLLNVVAHTVTWTLKSTAPATPIYEIRESYGTLGELRMTAGHSGYLSTDGAATWAAVETSAGTATRMTAGFDTNAVGFTGDATPIKYEGATDPGVPVLIPAVDGITALTAGWRIQELYAADDESPARLYRSDSTLATFTQTSTANHQVNHMIRSGNEDGVVYLAVGDGSTGVNGVQKSVDRLDSVFYTYRSGTNKCYMVGYGAAHLPVIPVTSELLLVSRNQNPGGVWHYVPGVGWVLKNTGLPVSIFWKYVTVSPFNPDHWLLLGNTTSNDNDYAGAASQMYMANGSTPAVWLTTNAGASWSAVTLSISGTKVYMRSIEWSDFTSGQWFAVLGGPDPPGAALPVSNVMRGSGAASTSRVDTSSFLNPSFVINGYGGDIVTSEDDSNGAGVSGVVWRSTIAGSDNQIYDPATLGAFIENPTPLLMDRGIIPSPALYGVNRNTGGASTQFYYSPDYRVAGGPGSLDHEVATSIAVAADGVYLGARQTSQIRTRVTRCTNFAYSHAPSTDATSTCTQTDLFTLSGGERVGHIRSSRQRRTAVAFRIVNAANTLDDVYAYDGTTWTRVTGPAQAANYFENLIEVIERV